MPYQADFTSVLRDVIQFKPFLYCILTYMYGFMYHSVHRLFSVDPQGVPVKCITLRDVLISIQQHQYNGEVSSRKPLSYADSNDEPTSAIHENDFEKENKDRMEIKDTETTHTPML